MTPLAMVLAPQALHPISNSHVTIKAQYITLKLLQTHIIPVLFLLQLSTYAVPVYMLPLF